MDNLDNKEQHYAPITQNVGDGNEFAIWCSKLSLVVYTLQHFLYFHADNFLNYTKLKL